MGDGTSFGLLFAKMCDAVQKGSSLKLDVSPPHKPSTERCVCVCILAEGMVKRTEICFMHTTMASGSSYMRFPLHIYWCCS